MYVVPPAYKIMLSRSGAHTKRAGEQTNSVIMLTTALSEWVHAAGSWYNSTLMSCEGKVAVEFIGWT